jgi:ADP-ribose diphosphatase
MANAVPARPWRVLQSTYPLADRWLRVRRDMVALPGGAAMTPPPVIEYPDWVDVIALTADHEIVLVDQYRHPILQIRTEFPAGAVEGDEEPLAAVKRELLEETGYASEEWHLLGSAAVYPAIQTNRIHSFLALNARSVSDQDLDEGESIRIRVMPFAEFVEKVEAGTIELPALQLAGLWWLTSVKR